MFQPAPPDASRSRWPSAWALLPMLAVLAACGTPAPTPSKASVRDQVVASPTPAAPVPAAPATPAARTTGTHEIKTRNALFKAADFNDLPGWPGDDLADVWDAFHASCKALDRREAWKEVCVAFDKVPRRSPEVRRFFEREFALFQILNTDASRDGDVTGYYEPLIAGSTSAQGIYTVPVYGTPNDLYSIDWKSIPAAHRRGIVNVVLNGRELVVVPSPRAGSVTLDASQFEVDTRDRRWRVRVDGGVARPYPTRSEIESAARVDAPVIAWVDDPLALYAMQVQGTGRIQLRDGRVLRLQYAEQNGRPFRPLRLAPRPRQGVATRGLDAVAQPERFELAEPADDASLEDGGAVRVAQRGLKPAAPTRTPPQTSPNGASGASAKLVDELLGTSRHPAASATARTKAGSALRVGALRGDPSYVFFRVAADQSPSQGPIGALGVPLTAGRSIAVDPRVTPMGYPVYMSAPTPAGSAQPLQRLVVAQDTGGAIRGAIRADFFWGFGADAGRQAMRTRQRGQMWLLLPRSEAATLLSHGVATRGLRQAPARSATECLIADASFCTEAD